MRRADIGRGIGAGAAAGVAAVAVLFAYRYATGMPTLPEALAERMIRLLPYQLFALLLAKLQHLAKPLGFAMATVSLVVGAAAGGVIYTGLTGRSRRPRAVLALVTAAVSWVFLTYVFLPLIEGSTFGVPLTTVIASPEAPMGLAALVYAAVLALLGGPFPARRLAGASGGAGGAPVGGGRPVARRSADTLSRRDAVRNSALVAAGAIVGTRLAAWANAAAARAASAATHAFMLIKGMPPEVTPNGQFYQISKNFFDPVVDPGKWTLEVKGLVARPLRLTLEEFKKAAPAVERYQTFECISNEVGGDLIGNAKWKGVRVRDILALAEVKPGARTIIWHAADGYTESIPLDVAMEPESLLAYEMNGEPIPEKHGTPVRVLMLNRYGMKQPKWLTAIEVTNQEYRSTRGYWEQQGWSQDAYVKVNSAFRVETKDGAAVALGGWAFAGDRGIAKVEISADGGKTWFPAAVKEPLAVNTWQFWSATWTPPKPGDYTFKVRATDGKGTLQPEEPKPTLPDGGQGYHTVKIHWA
jgi:DMSO/TMAO reductase YedYZ molybdopterin-dependent catalytic subunit